MTTATTHVQEPMILTAPVYFWSPASHASGRRSNEQRRIDEVATWLESLGLEVVRQSNEVLAQGHGIDVTFRYSESCNHVYKHLDVRRLARPGKWIKSNITALRKLALSQANA